MLNLADNALTSLGAEEFSGMEFLKSLNLSNNSISSFSVATFQDLPNLESLDLSLNELSEIPGLACFTGIWGDCTHSCCEAGLTCYVQQYKYAQCIQGPCPDGWDCTVAPPTLGSRQDFWRGILAKSRGESDTSSEEPQGSTCSVGLWDECVASEAGCCPTGTECVKRNSDSAQCRPSGDCPRGWACEPPRESCELGFYSECSADLDSGCCVDGYECRATQGFLVGSHDPGVLRCLPVDDSSEAHRDSCDLEPGSACGFGLGCCAGDDYECVVKDTFPQCYPRAANCGARRLGETQVCELNRFSLGCCAEGYQCDVSGETGRCRAGPPPPPQPPPDNSATCRKTPWIAPWEECTARWKRGCCQAGSTCAEQDPWWAMCVPLNVPCPAGYTCARPPASNAAAPPAPTPPQCAFVVSNPSFEATSIDAGAGWVARDRPDWVSARVRRDMKLTTIVDPREAVAGNSYLLVTNRRHATWQAPEQKLDKACLDSGVAYQVSASFRLPARAKCYTGLRRDGCPEILLRRVRDGEEMSSLGWQRSGVGGEWNRVTARFTPSNYQLRGQLSIVLVVDDAVDFEVDNVTVTVAPDSRQDNSDAKPPVTPSPAEPGPNQPHAPSPDPTKVPPQPQCTLVLYDNCHNPVHGCCTAGLLCYRANEWFSQCRRPGTCFDHWDCSVPTLDNAPVSTITAFGALTNLKVLDLRQNAITQLADRTFTGLARLEKLDLEGNKIAEVRAGAFHGLWKLEHLELSDNAIRQIDWETVRELLSVVYLGLFHNPLNCLPLFPETVRFGGVSYAQAKSLTGCLPRGCSRHVDEALPGSANRDQQRPLILDKVKAIESVLALLRPDARARMDAVNLGQGLYVYGAGPRSERVWCMGGGRKFDLGWAVSPTSTPNNPL